MQGRDGTTGPFGTRFLMIPNEFEVSRLPPAVPVGIAGEIGV
jgi:hypothetical protein